MRKLVLAIRRALRCASVTLLAVLPTTLLVILLFAAPCMAQSWYQSIDISAQPITGSLYDAHLLPNGNYLYAIGRGNSGHTGVEEVTPSGTLVFSWNDPTWRVPTDGPEYAIKLANGDYIIVDADAAITNATYEMTPTHVKVWALSGINYQAEPITFNGSAALLMEPQGADISYAAIFSYPNLAKLWNYTVGNTNNFFALRGDFRVIGGKNKVLYTDSTAHTVNQIDVTNSTVDYTCTIPGLASGPKGANYITDQDVLVAEGSGGQHGGRVAVINLPTCAYVQETPQFGGTTNSAYMTDSLHAIVADNTAQIKIAQIFPNPTANPAPYLNQPPSPAAVVPGGAGLTVTVNGTGFVSGSVVNWNGSARATTFVNGAQLTATILASDIAVPGTATITVTSSTPGGGTSNPIFLQVANANAVSTFNAPYMVSPAYTASVAATGDFNGDGNLDFVVIGKDDVSISVSLGNGDGTFQSPISTSGVGNCGGSSCVEYLAVGDFNGDGRLDVAAAVKNGNGTFDVVVLLGKGDGTFQSGVATANLSTVGPLYVADFNGDGKLDLLTVCGSSDGTQICVLPGNGDGTFGTAISSTISSAEIVDSISVGDFNGDGKLDLAVAYRAIESGGIEVPTLAIMLGNGDGTFGSATTVDSTAAGSSNFAQATVADFNGDGKLDVAYTASQCNLATNTCSTHVDVLLGNGNGTFQAPITTPVTGNGCCEPLAGDFNADGKLDLLISGGGSPAVLLGNGAGLFSQSSPTPPVSASAVGDFNNDGRLDILSAGGSAQAGGTAQVSLQAEPDFTGSVSPQSQTVIAGESVSYQVNLAGVNGFLGTVALTASGLPAGVTATFTPATLTGNGSASMNVIVPSNAAPGTYTLTVTGTSGSLIHSLTVSLTITAAIPDFEAVITPVSEQVASGGSTSYSMQLTAYNGFNGSVALSVTGLPSGATGTFTPPTVAGGNGSSTLNISTTAATPSGKYTLAVTGMSGAVTHTYNVTLVVNAALDFTGTVSPQSQQWVASNCTSCVPIYTVKIVPLAGFTGNVSLTFSAAAGFAGSFNPAVVTGGSGTSILSFTSAPTTPGTYPITITGTSGNIAHSTTAYLVVLPPMDFAGSITPTSRTVAAGSSTSYNITISPLRGFNSNVALSVSGGPAGVTAAFNPATITGGSGSSVLNVTTASTTTPGTYTLTVTGTGGGVTHSATVSLTVNPAP